MRGVMGMVWLGLCVGCGGGDVAIGTSRGNVMQESCAAGQASDCPCEGAACTPTDMDFGNAGSQADAGGDGTGGAALPGVPQALEHCDAGLYLGTYECELIVGGFPSVLAGDVAFNLEINEEQVECEPGQEFCADLVISEGSGVLFGLAVGWGFEAELRGGLDCQTGEFRTEPLDGVYGAAISSDPNDPDALWTVQKPPAGMFKGDLSGQHQGEVPQVIEGQWSLFEEGFASCTGGFTTQLQP